MEMIFEHPLASEKTTIQILSGNDQHSTNKQLINFLAAIPNIAINNLSLTSAEIYSFPPIPAQQILIVLDGTGKLGDREAGIINGDLIIIPPKQSCRLLSGKDGLQATLFQLNNKQASQQPNIEIQLKIAQLLSTTEIRSHQFAQIALFESIKLGLLNDAEKFQLFTHCMQIWVSKNQTPLYHSKNEKKYNTIEFFDPMLEALIDWLNYQMIILDQIEKKILIKLVIEKAGAIYHTVVQSYVNPSLYNAFFTEHLKTYVLFSLTNDELYKQNLSSLIRIHDFLDQGWNALEAIMDRILKITEGEANL